MAREQPTVRTVTLAERPDLAEAVPVIVSSRWPAFLLAGHPGHQVDLTALLARGFPEHQILLIDGADQVLGVGLSVGLWWDGTVAGLPDGWDATVTASADLVDRGAIPNVVSALSITIAPQAAGHGHARRLLTALRAAGARAGATGMLAPVRPVLKSSYPLTSMARYIDWRTDEGGVFDPWLRLHLHLGATVLAIAERSLTVTGTVAEWERWVDLTLPDSGEYIIPGGLVPLTVDAANDCGIYREPNVWVLHPAG